MSISNIKISFAIIGHNEAGFLSDCFESIKDIAYEIVYVDCESKDESVEIAKKFNAKIFFKKNDFNLNVNKQFAIDNCTGNWIFYIDPDERLTDELKSEILYVLKNTNCSGFLIPRKNFYFNKHLRYGGKYPDKQLRLFKNKYGFFECRSIHERITLRGKICEMKNPFIHIVVRDMRHLITKMDSYRIRTSEEYKRLGKSVHGIVFKSIRRFFVNYFLKFGFLDGLVGFFVALIDLFNGIGTYFEIKCKGIK
jgi:glycosyltransferase involved in cell wall biosynthesis